MTQSKGRNMAPNEKLTQYKRSCAVTAKRWKHTVHHLRSSVLAGIKDFVTTYASPSRTQNHSLSAIGHNRSSNLKTRPEISRQPDPVQDMIDSIVANSMFRDQPNELSRGDPVCHTAPNILSNQQLDSATTTPFTSLTASPDPVFSSSASETIDIAFSEDARWRGVHPFNVKVKNLARFEALIPHGFRYARDLQVEAAFIPPPRHPRASPGKDFVLQKRGTSAIPIVDPNTMTKVQSTSTRITSTLTLHNEAKDNQGLPVAGQASCSAWSQSEAVVKVHLPLLTSNPSPSNMVKNVAAISEMETLVQNTGDARGSFPKPTSNLTLNHCAALSVPNSIRVNTVKEHISVPYVSLVGSVRRSTRRRQA